MGGGGAVAQGPSVLGTFKEWFSLADQQRTGMITGQDAVQFFTRSGLHKTVLAQVWEFADVQKRGCLSFEEFVTALRLIAFAQMTANGRPEGGLVDLQQARMALANPAFPGVPFLQGLPPPQMQPQPPPPQQQQQPQMQMQHPARPAPMPPTNATPGASPGGPVACPPGMNPQALARFRQAFAQLDTDRDGFVAGGECFPVFMKSGLDKGVLKSIWDLVAGNEGKLNEQQFVMSQHLILGALKGEPLPTSLPPMAGSGSRRPSLQQESPPAPTMAGPGGLMNAPQQMQPSFQMPGALPQATRMSPPAANNGGFQYASTVPAPPAALAMNLVSQDEKRRMEEAQERARKADEEKQRAAMEAQQAQQNKDLYRNAMQELVIFKSRADTEMIQLGAQLNVAKSELERSQRLYDDLFLQYGDIKKAHEEKRESLAALQAEKLKLAEEIQQLQMSSEQGAGGEDEFAVPLQQAQAEVTELQSQLRLLKSQRLQQQREQQGVLGQVMMEKSDLERQIEAAEAETSLGQEELGKLQGDVIRLRGEAEAALMAADRDRGALAAVIQNCGGIFAVLSQAALSSGVEIPQFSGLKLEWSEGLANSAAAWEGEEGSAAAMEGFTKVESLDAAQTLQGSGGGAGHVEAGFRVHGSEVQVSLETKDGGSGAAGPSSQGNGETNGGPAAAPAFAASAALAADPTPTLETAGSGGFGTNDVFGSGSSTARSDAASPQVAPVGQDLGGAIDGATASAGNATANAPAPQADNASAKTDDWFSFDS